jgi:hypothetical protein
MTSLTPLHEALLELGLEDQIPLPEIATTQEVRALDGVNQFPEISSALVDLLRAGRIDVWSGRWPDEPVVVSDDLAETLLRDQRRYSFEAEAADEVERVYFSNVENIRG